MKKIILSFICLLLFLISCPANAQFKNNWPMPTTNKEQDDEVQPSDDEQKPVENIWEQEYTNAVDERYGSDQSPAFLNREKMNPNESDYGYSGNTPE